MKIKPTICAISILIVAMLASVPRFSTITKASELESYCEDVRVALDDSQLETAIRLIEKLDADEIDCMIDENIDCHSGTLLIYATRKGFTEIVELLISKGAAINARDLLGNSALKYASYFNFPKIAELLIANGAIIDDFYSDESTIKIISVCDIDGLTF